MPSSDVSTLPSSLPSPSTASALTVIGEVSTFRPSRFRSSAGTVRLRIWPSCGQHGRHVRRRDQAHGGVHQPQQVAELLVEDVDVQRLPGQVVEQVRQVVDDVAQDQARAGLGGDADVDRAGVDQRPEQVELHRRDVQREHVGRGHRPDVERAAAEVDPQVGRVEQADGRAQHLVQGVGGLLQVDQVRRGGQQVAQQLAVAGVGRDADDDLAGLHAQAEQVDVERRQDDRGQAVGVRGRGRGSSRPT